MTLPVWMLLGFSTWTVLLLVGTVGVYRWRYILTGSAEISSFPAAPVEGADWYLRGTRAHANCIENLPVFGAVVFALHVANVVGTLVNILAAAILISRIMQSFVHVCFVQTNTAVSLRFAFFSVQAAGFLWLIGIIVSTHLKSS